MVSKLLIGWGLMACCVVIHALGVTWSVRRLRARAVVHDFWASSWMFIRLTELIIAVHLIEVLVWALFYALTHAMPDLPSSLYFSAVTYTTTGYGDLVLPPEWRLLGAIEALTGILMCGWSTGFFFAVVSRMMRLDRK